MTADDRPEAAGPPRAALTPLERLTQTPARFSLDQAVKVLAPDRDPADVDFRCVAQLGMPAGEVGRAGDSDTALGTPTFGLVGPGGVLPRHYTAWVDDARMLRSKALQGFMDLLSRRFTGLFVKAGSKYAPMRNPELAEKVLAAAVGLGTPHLASGLIGPLRSVLLHAGSLSSRGRSAERLRGMLSEETGCAVRIIEFAGGWVRLPRSEQTRLPAYGVAGQNHRLASSQPGSNGSASFDAALGAQVWDAAGRFLVHLGPLPLDRFRSLLPGASLHRRLVELIRLHVGLEVDFAFNPVLAAQEVPALRLGAPGQASAQLGWTSWLTRPGGRRLDADEAMLGAWIAHDPGRAA